MDEVDPVLGSLSVNLPWWMDILHLHFSHHTEHHLFPAMSHKYAPMVKKLLRELYPDRYNEVTALEGALAALENAPPLP